MTAEEEVPDWEDPRRVMRRHGLAPKRRFSQNFLVSRHAVERIAAAVAPRPGETVVELGPGLGTLTGELLRAGATVIGVERDPDMVAVLKRELGHLPRFEVRPGDAATFDLAAVADELGISSAGDERGPGAPRIALAGNLPYAITGAILKNACEHRRALRVAVLMVQREVALRLAAAPGTKEWGALTVFVQAGFEVSTVCRVPAGAFHPAPRVDSAVVRLTPRARPLAEETPAFQAVVKAAFGQRRKTLRNGLKSIVLNTEALDRALEARGVDGGVRAETLSIETLAGLAAELAPSLRAS